MTPEELLALFTPGALAATPSAEQSVFLPSEMPDPVGVARQTLEAFGAPSPAPYQALGAPPPAAPTVAPAPLPPVVEEAQVTGMQSPSPAGPPSANLTPGRGVSSPPASEAPRDWVYNPRNLGEAEAYYARTLEDSMASQRKANQAQFDANKARQQSVADADKKYAEDMGDLQLQFQERRAAAEAKIAQEQAAWINELTQQAKQEPNPGRWWENQSTLGKALWAISALAGAYVKAYAPGGENLALPMIQKAIEQDMAEQRARLARELDSLKAKGQLMSQRHTRVLSDGRDDHTMALSRLQALQRAWQSQTAVPTTADEAAAQAATEAAFDTLKSQYAGNRLNQRSAEAQAQAQRDFQAEQARLSLGHQAWQNSLNRQHDLARDEKRFAHEKAMAEVSLGGTTRPFSPGDPLPVDPKTGLPRLFEMQSGAASPDAGLVLRKGEELAHGTGVVRFRTQEEMIKAGDAVHGYNEMYTALVRLRDKIKGKYEGRSAKAATLIYGEDDPEINALMSQVGYAQARVFDPGGKLSDNDVFYGLKARTGFNPDSKKVERLKFVTNINEIVKQLDSDIASLPKQLTDNLRQFNHAEINGQGTEVVWRPQFLRAADVPEMGAREAAGQGRVGNVAAGKGPGHYAPIQSIAELDEREAIEATDPTQRGELLPDYDKAMVNKVLVLKGQPSHVVEAKAAELLEALDKKEAALGSVRTAKGQQEGDTIAETRHILDVVSREMGARARVAEAQLRQLVPYFKLTGASREEAYKKVLERTGTRLLNSAALINSVINEVYGK